MENNFNQTTIGYEGLVDVKYFARGKELNLKAHNHGLPAMFKYLCKCLAGATNNINLDRPAYLDIRCEYSDPEEGKKADSCLNGTLSLSKPTFYFDTTISSWVAQFSIVLAYNMIKFDAIVPDSTIKLVIESARKEDFAEIVLDQNKLKLSDIIPGTQALIQWTMVLKNVNPVSSN